MFCLLDACAHTHCKESRSSKSSSPYCGKHACKVKNCDMPRQSPGLYCKKHTCHGKGCVNCVDPPSSEGKQEPSYCHGHQVCQVDGCDALVFLDPSNRAALFCFRHYCAASNGCAGQRVDGEGAQAVSFLPIKHGLLLPLFYPFSPSRGKISQPGRTLTLSIQPEDLSQTPLPRDRYKYI